MRDIVGDYTCTVAGHLCVDLAPALDHGPHLTPGSLQEVGAMTVLGGGCVANTGADLTALGTATRLVASVGDDPLGQLLRSELERAGCQVNGITAQDELQTSYSVVIEAPGRDRLFWHHVGANAGFDGTAVDHDGSMLVHLGYPSILPRLLDDDAARLRVLLTRLRDDDVTTSLDLAAVDPGSPTWSLDWPAIFDHVLPLTDMLSASVDDLAVLRCGQRSLIDWARWLVGRGCGVALVKGGADGLALATAGPERLATAGAALSPLATEWADRSLVVGAAPVTVVSTRGAGDAATAGLLHGICSCAPPDVAIEIALLAATYRVATGPGPLPSASRLRLQVDAVLDGPLPRATSLDEHDPHHDPRHDPDGDRHAVPR